MSFTNLPYLIRAIGRFILLMIGVLFSSEYRFRVLVVMKKNLLALPALDLVFIITDKPFDSGNIFSKNQCELYKKSVSEV
jgi:hypothetical protein